MQRLAETDGKVLRPKDWFFTNEGTARGWMWTVSNENPAIGPAARGPGKYRVVYSVYWGKQLDMVVVSTFGAPPDTWTEVAPVIDAMSQIQLIGPNHGKQSCPITAETGQAASRPWQR